LRHRAAPFRLLQRSRRARTCIFKACIPQ
jgi:hypothetical protein